MNWKGIVRTNKWRFTFILLLVVLDALFISISQYLDAPAYNFLKKLSFTPFLLIMGLSILGQLLSKCLKSWADYLYNRQIQTYSHQIRLNISRNLSQEKVNTAKVQNDLLTNLNKLNQNYALPIFEVVDQVLFIIFSVGMLFTFNWLLVVLTFVFTFISLSLPKLFENSSSRATMLVTDKNEKLLNTIQKWANGLDELRRYASFSIFNDALSNANHELKNAQIKQGQKIAIADITTSLFNMLAQMLLVLAPSILYFQNQLSFGGVMAAINFATGIMSQLTTLVANLNLIKSSDKINKEILSIQQKISLPHNTYTVKKLEKIEIKDLSCQFHNSEKISYPDLIFNRGEKILITGDSGTGKSTLFKLLLGLVPKAQGNINYLDKDGQALKFNLNELAYIAQDGVLFPDTIQNNITMFDGKLNTDVLTSVKKADLADDLQNFADGLKTQIDLDQNNLSGGQKQKVILARAFVHQNPWLFIDEGTSAIDSKATKTILQNLLKEENTVIMIAHNFSDEMIKMFDRHIELKGENYES